MTWFKRKRKERPAPGSVDREVAEVPLHLDSLDLDRLVRMSNNVMWCRENLEAMLEYIEVHRSDGHECPPFCLPQGIAGFLNKLEKEHLFMLLVVLMKDLEISFVTPEDWTP